MSAYFQQLIRQSGLRVQNTPPSPSAENSPESPRSSHTPAPVSDNNDIVELHHEQIAPTEPSSPFSRSEPISPHANPVVTPSTPAAVTPDAPRASPVAPPASATTSSTGADPIAVTENIVLTPGKSTRPSNSPSATPPSQKKNSPAHPSFDPTQEGLPAEALDEIMRWIAAGQKKEEASPQQQQSPQTPASLEKSTTAPSSAANIVESKKSPDRPPTPERAIQIIEEHFDSAPTPSTAPSERNSPSRDLTVSPSTTQTASQDSVHVSIGAIHVRMDAPAPTPPPSRSARPEPARSSPSSRSSGLSKLRRHYILPH